MARSPAFGYLTRQLQRTAATKRLYTEYDGARHPFAKMNTF
jgi:hypothetical protein